MSWAAIGEVTTKVVKWNPSSDGTGTITYVDLSSVDQSRKAIAEPSVIQAVEAPSRARQLIRVGDVLVSTVRPNLNAVAQVQGELDGATASTGFAVLRPKSERLDGRYLFHWVRSSQFIGRMEQLATGASYPAVSDKIVRASEIPLPGIEEQRRIAGVLDAADALRAKRRQALAKLDTLTQSIFIDMFGDLSGLTELSDVADIQGGLQVSAKRSVNPIAVPYLRVANVYRGRLDLSEIKELNATESEVKRTALEVDDLLVVEGHGNKNEIGRVAIWNGSIELCVHQNHLIRVRCDREKVYPRFVEAFMNSQSGRQALLHAANTTSGLNTISSGDVRSVRLPSPPVWLQATFVERAEAVDRMRSGVLTAQSCSDDLFASLQQRAFRGEL